MQVVERHGRRASHMEAVSMAGHRAGHVGGLRSKQAGMCSRGQLCGKCEVPNTLQ